MPTPVQPSTLGTLESGGSISGRDFYLFGITVLALNTQDMPPVKIRREPRLGAHGQFVIEEHYDSRPLMLSGQMIANTPADLRTNIDAFKSFLNVFRRNQPRRIKLVDPKLTDRFVLCYFDGEAVFGEPAPRLAGTIIDFSVRLLAEPPFAQAVDLSQESYAAPAGTFRTISTGTFDSDPMMVLKGPATNPKIVFGDSIFICDFNLTTSFTDIFGDTTAGTFTGTAPQAAALFSPSSLGLGHSFLASGAYRLSWSVAGNRSAGTWFVIVEPQFDSPTAGIYTLFEHRYNDNNRIYLFYQAGQGSDVLDRRFILVKWAAGAGSYITSSIQNFVSGQALKIGVSYDDEEGMKIFINGEIDGQNGNTVALATNPATLSLNANGVDFSANMKVHYLAGWSSALTENEQALIAGDPEENIKNRNEVFLWTGVLDTGDYLEMEKRDGRYQGQLMDVSAGTVTGAKFPDNGYIIPSLAAETTAIYHPTGIAEVVLQWRNRYL